MSFANLIAKFFVSKSSRSKVDEFISLDKDGNARFDLAAYLHSSEGRKRVEALASDPHEETKIEEAA